MICDDVRMQCLPTRWLRAQAPEARIIARRESGEDQERLVQSGAGLALLLARERDQSLVRVIEDIGLVIPFYLLMHKDMQRTLKVRAFADFVGSEIVALRKLVFG